MNSSEKKLAAIDEFKKNNPEEKIVECDVIISGAGKKMIRVWNSKIAAIYGYENLNLLRTFKMKPMKKD